MKGDIMLLKAMNFDAVVGKDTFPDYTMKLLLKHGYRPKKWQSLPPLQLHYMYADRYEIIG